MKKILFVLFGLIFVFGCTQQTSQPTVTRNVSVDDDPVKGVASAPVTMIEFSDYQCPYCGTFYAGTLKQIEEKYINTGKVKLVYRDYPLKALHENAQKAAEASECAHEQGKFWEYHNKLFENQNALLVSNLKQYALDVELDADKFNECLDSGKMAQEVENDLRDGQLSGVSGTPSFFINGVYISGAQPYNVFEKVIEAELQKSR